MSFKQKFMMFIHNVKLNADLGKSANNNGNAEKLKESISTDWSHRSC